MVQVEKTIVGKPAEKQQSIGLASRLLSYLGVYLVDCSKILRERNLWMMKWSANKLSVFFKYRYSTSSSSYYYRCHFELEPSIDSSFPKFLTKVAVFEDPLSTGKFTVWKENPFFGMSEEQMKIALDLAGATEERGEEKK